MPKQALQFQVGDRVVLSDEFLQQMGNKQREVGTVIAVSALQADRQLVDVMWDVQGHRSTLVSNLILEEDEKEERLGRQRIQDRYLKSQRQKL